MISSEQFEHDYINKSNLTQPEYNAAFVTLRCKCSDADCKGFTAVGNDELSIKTHNNLYGGLND